MIIKPLSKRRTAYTLVEILVVLGIVLAVMSLVVAFYPNYNQREQHNRAADVIKNALMRARQWAQRDKVPTGISFVPPNLTLGETEAKIVFFQNAPILYGTVGDFTFKGTTNGVILSQNAGKVRMGDFFIDSRPIFPEKIPYFVKSDGNPNTGFVELTSSIDTSNKVSHFFSIIRGPRPLESEPPIALSQNVTVQVQDSSGTQIPYIPNIAQLIFNPRGQIEPSGIGKYTIIVILNEADGSTELDRISLSIDAVTGTTRGN